MKKLLFSLKVVMFDTIPIANWFKELQGTGQYFKEERDERGRNRKSTERV